MLFITLLFAAYAAAAPVHSIGYYSTLPEIFNAMPHCGWQCWEAGARKEGCAATELDCISEHVLDMAYDMNDCVTKGCSDRGSGVGEVMGYMTVRYRQDPPKNETDAAVDIIKAKLKQEAGSNSKSAGVLLTGSAGIAALAAVFPLLLV